MKEKPKNPKALLLPILELLVAESAKKKKERHEQRKDIILENETIVY